MKSVYLPGQKQGTFCAIGPFDKEAAVHIASSPSSRNAKACMEKAVARFGKNIEIVNGDGSENMKDAEGYPASLNIT
ncbi:MAG: hypothetical protein LBH43_07790 [Treponema sp.]|jgi:hypothetical protein|nr:hypothetical protein [Treponema sp.]